MKGGQDGYGGLSGFGVLSTDVQEDTGEGKTEGVGGSCCSGNEREGTLSDGMGSRTQVAHIARERSRNKLALRRKEVRREGTIG